MADFDILDAINKVSDVVQNRPRPLRNFDQIYMKTGDMVRQSQVVAAWANDCRLAFIGDGDAVSVCVAYLYKGGVFDFGPTKITVSISTNASSMPSGALLTRNAWTTFLRQRPTMFSTPFRSLVGLIAFTPTLRGVSTTTAGA
jgi:hypothetical protein